MTRAKLRRGVRKRKEAREVKERKDRRVPASSVLLPPPELREGHSHVRHSFSFLWPTFPISRWAGILCMLRRSPNDPATRRTDWIALRNETTALSEPLCASTGFVHSSPSTRKLLGEVVQVGPILPDGVAYAYARCA